MKRQRPQILIIENKGEEYTGVKCDCGGEFIFYDKKTCPAGVRCNRCNWYRPYCEIK